MKTTSQPTPHPSTMVRPKNENASSSPSAKSPTKVKSKIHNSVKSLIDRQDKNLIDEYKFLSNSLNCLDVAQL
jgi:hypothetical protein